MTPGIGGKFDVSEIIISQPEISEAGQIFTIQQQGIKASYVNEASKIFEQDLINCPSYRQQSPANWEKLIEQCGQNKQIFVAKIENLVIGYVFIKSEAMQQICATYVLNKFRGNGVGSKLAKIAVQWFSPKQTIIVDVPKYNELGIRFYKNLGFTQTGQNPKIDLIPGKKIELERLSLIQ